MRSLSYQPGTPHSAGGMLSPALLTVSTLSRHKDTSGACCRRNWKGSRPGLPLQSDTPGLRHGVPSECTREHMPRLRGQRTPARPMAARGPPLATPSPPVRDPTPPQVLPRSSPDRPQVRKNPHWNVAPRACVGLKPARVSHLSHFLSRVSILCNEACADSKLAGGDVVLPHYAKPFPTSE